MITRPKLIDQIIPFVDKDIIKVLVGIRRCGKSTMFKLLQLYLISNGVKQNDFIEVNFESLKWSTKISDFEDLYNELSEFCAECNNRGCKPYVFVDEIQTIENWEKAINSLRVDYNCDIYISGSNSNLLAGELATLLSGRYVSFDIMPFSFVELCEAFPGDSVDEVYDKYSTLGGFPFLTHIDYDEASSVSYLQDVFSSVVLKDIISRNNLRNPEQLSKVLTYFISEIGTTFSVDNIVNTITSSGQKISTDTVYKYLNASETAMLLNRVKRYDIKGKEILRGSEKAYLTDIGLRQALLGNNDKRKDLVLENIVYIELKRQGYSITIGKIGDKEIDFVAEKNSRRIYIQVAYSLELETTRNREFSALLSVHDAFPKMIVSTDEIDWSEQGITCINIKEFLTRELS